MMGHSNYFSVVIGRSGNVQCTVLPGMDTGEQVIFEKEALRLDVTALLERAFNSGRACGREQLQDELRSQLGIR